MEQKIKHLEMIQGIITRMASNSFMLKGWAVTLVAAIFALADKDSRLLFSIISCVPVVAFACLDAYYLMMERRYRALYDKVRITDTEDIDFSMHISLSDFEGTGINVERLSFDTSLFSKSVMAFYVPLFGICVIATVLVAIL